MQVGARGSAFGGGDGPCGVLVLIPAVFRVSRERNALRQLDPQVA